MLATYTLQPDSHYSSEGYSFSSRWDFGLAVIAVVVIMVFPGPFPSAGQAPVCRTFRGVVGPPQPVKLIFDGDFTFGFFTSLTYSLTTSGLWSEWTLFRGPNWSYD